MGEYWMWNTERVFRRRIILEEKGRISGLNSRNRTLEVSKLGVHIRDTKSYVGMLLGTLNQLLSYFDWLKTFHWLPISFSIKAKNPSSGSLPDLPSYFSILISSTTLLLIHSSLFTVALFLGLTHAKHNLSYLRVFAQTIPSAHGDMHMVHPFFSFTSLLICHLPMRPSMIILFKMSILTSDHLAVFF